jgi:hypothetical protein
MAERRRDVLMHSRRSRGRWRVRSAAAHLARGAALTLLVTNAALAVPDAAEPAPRGEKGDEARQGGSVLLLPVWIVRAREPGPDRPSAAPARPAVKDAAAIAEGQKLDAVLSDGVQDLGLTLDLSGRPSIEPADLTEADLVDLAAKGGHWVIAPSIDARSSDLLVRIVAVAPSSNVASVRTERMKPSDLPLRGVVMLRDLIETRAPRGAADHGRARRADSADVPQPLAIPARSQGRAILAANAALFGGFVGYSIQRSSGSDDPRLLYPLMALGATVGIGGATIVADEWDVGVGDAWYLSAGGWWPALAGLSIARGKQNSQTSERYTYGLVGAASGLGLATFSLAVGGGMSEGGALMTHSGGAIGTFLGAMTEFAYRGTTEGEAPYRGFGYGAAAGVTVAGVLATQVSVDPSRVLLIDLGAGLGGLVGAAATSPFIFGRDKSQVDYRAFVLTTMGTTVVGGAAAWFWSRKTGGRRANPGVGVPFAGIIGESFGPDGKPVPVFGAGLRGELR